MTLTELLVGMGIMVVCMGMVTTAMFLMTSTSNKVNGVATSSAQLTSAYLTLDREVRYATGISTPQYDAAAPAWSVAFSSIVIDRTTAVNATQTQRCTQLRTYQNQLLQRFWNVDSGGKAVGGSGTDWQPIASQLNSSTTAAASDTNPAPFTVAQAANGLQQLTVRLGSNVTSGSSATNSSGNVVYTALNSAPASGSADPTTVCTQVAPGAVTP